MWGKQSKGNFMISWPIDPPKRHLTSCSSWGVQPRPEAIECSLPLTSCITWSERYSIAPSGSLPWWCHNPQLLTLVILNTVPQTASHPTVLLTSCLPLPILLFWRRNRPYGDIAMKIIHMYALWKAQFTKAFHFFLLQCSPIPQIERLCETHFNSASRSLWNGVGEASKQVLWNERERWCVDTLAKCTECGGKRLQNQDESNSHPNVLNTCF